MAFAQCNLPPTEIDYNVNSRSNYRDSSHCNCTNGHKFNRCTGTCVQPSACPAPKQLEPCTAQANTDPKKLPCQSSWCDIYHFLRLELNFLWIKIKIIENMNTHSCTLCTSTWIKKVFWKINKIINFHILFFFLSYNYKKLSSTNNDTLQSICGA